MAIKGMSAPSTSVSERRLNPINQVAHNKGSGTGGDRTMEALVN